MIILWKKGNGFILAIVLYLTLIFVILISLSVRGDGYQQSGGFTPRLDEPLQLSFTFETGEIASLAQNQAVASILKAGLAVVVTSGLLRTFLILLHTTLPGDERVITAILESRAIQAEAFRKSSEILRGSVTPPERAA